jgi:hypothetical protein
MQSPYLLPWMNHLWTGLWCTLVYMTGLQLVLHYYQLEEPFDLEVPSVQLAFQESMTWAVLYGIFPALLLGECRPLCSGCANAAGLQQFAKP